jgi:dihydropteroate synthase
VRWMCRDRIVDVSSHTVVMGILNITPDSFSDGGRNFDPSTAVKAGIDMVNHGAEILDVGGESTRPGAEEVSEPEELRRVIPVIKALSKEVGVAISVDTTKSAVAAAAIEAGAHIVNDVSAMRHDASMSAVVCDSGAGVVLMHMLGSPRTMQTDPTYADVVSEVQIALAGWAEAAIMSGIGRDRIVLDPGIGFGKTREHNLSLLRHVDRLMEEGYPVMVGPSRKSFIGAVLDLAVEERLEGTAAAVAWLAAKGVQIVRVHDVRQMVRVVRMMEAITRS